MGTKRVAVIGAGIAGLSTAARLASCGYVVDVYEKNAEPGGKARVLSGGGFRFDKGPSLLTMPFVFEKHFTDVGEDMQDFLRVERLKLNCKYFYPDSTIINAYAEQEHFCEEIGNKTTDEPQRVMRFFEHCKMVYDMTAELFLFNSPLLTFKKPSVNNLHTLMHLSNTGMFRTLDKTNRNFLCDSKSIQLFNRYATYNGSSPFRAPATFTIIPHVEFTFGAYNVNDGIYAIPDALFRLARKEGARFQFNSEVQRIVHKHHRVRALVVNGKTRNYDVIVSNTDVHTTYRCLLEDTGSVMAKLYARKEPSSSALVFYWGVKGEFDNLQVHNIFFSRDYRKEFYELFNEKICPQDPTIYINITSKYVPTDAPKGYENWFVMINAPYLNGQDWPREIAQARQRIVEKLNRILDIDVNTKIVFEAMLTPHDLKRETGSSRGSIYGMSSNSLTGAFLRQQNKSLIYKGLYFCGGSAHPGGGMPLAVLSGSMTAELVMRYEH